MLPLRSLARATLLGLTALPLLAGPAGATWSIVAVDRSTGEVVVAGATCLSSNDLGRGLAVVVPGRGVAAAQSLVDITGMNRVTIWEGIQANWTPQEILDQLAATDNQHHKRQYGICTFTGPPVSFTGIGAGAAKKSVTGEVGPYWYAIQGNVLAGKEVVDAAEAALVNSERDLGMRVIDAMEAARRFGGDGRCSCDGNAPASCGSPPPDFDKSAHSAFLIQSRIGDTLGTCSLMDGCVNGDFFLKLDVPGQAVLTDPVARLRRAYIVWRENRRGHPDHYQSRVEPAVPRLVADGVTSTEVTVALVDLQGEPLTSGGHALEVVYTGPGPAPALAGPVVDHGDGTYGFELVATTDPGVGTWRVRVSDGADTVTLSPELSVPVDPLAELFVAYERVRASDAPQIPLVLNVPSAAGTPYDLIGSAAGTSPGVTIGGVLVPLNRDRLFALTHGAPGSPLFPGSAGVLDASGRAEARLELPTDALATLAGRTVHFVGLLPSPGRVTNLVDFVVGP